MCVWKGGERQAEEEIPNSFLNISLNESTLRLVRAGQTHP
jgi:hypothetical protein